MNSKFNSNKRVTLLIAYTAVLIALDTVLNFAAIDIGTLSIAFTYIPCFIAGMFLGPFSGGMVGLCGDLFGALIKGYTPSPIIAVSCMLIGVIPGLIFMIKKIHPYIKLTISLVLVLFICTLGLSSYGNWLLIAAGGSSKSFLAYWLVSRLPKQPIVVVANAIILYIIYYPVKKLIFDKMGNKTTTASDILESDEQVAVVEGAETKAENMGNKFTAFFKSKKNIDSTKTTQAEDTTNFQSNEILSNDLDSSNN